MQKRRLGTLERVPPTLSRSVQSAMQSTKRENRQSQQRRRLRMWLTLPERLALPCGFGSAHHIDYAQYHCRGHRHGQRHRLHSQSKRIIIRACSRTKNTITHRRWKSCSRAACQQRSLTALPPSSKHSSSGTVKCTCSKSSRILRVCRSGSKSYSMLKAD